MSDKKYALISSGKVFDVAVLDNETGKLEKWSNGLDNLLFAVDLTGKTTTRVGSVWNGTSFDEVELENAPEIDEAAYRVGFVSNDNVLFMSVIFPSLLRYKLYLSAIENGILAVDITDLENVSEIVYGTVWNGTEFVI